MSKKILGILVAGLLSGMGTVANASIVTPTYDDFSWQTFSYDTSAYIGGTLLIGVSDVRGNTDGNSILNLNNLVGLSLVTDGSKGIYSVDAGSYRLQTGDGVAIPDTGDGYYCDFRITPMPLGGDCSVLEFQVMASHVEFGWQVEMWDDAVVEVLTDPFGNPMPAPVEAADFAFFDIKGVTDAGRNGYLIPASPTNVPEPSTIALMAIGLLGAGVAVRRKQS